MTSIITKDEVFAAAQISVVDVTAEGRELKRAFGFPETETGSPDWRFVIFVPVEPGSSDGTTITFNRGATATDIAHRLEGLAAERTYRHSGT